MSVRVDEWFVRREGNGFSAPELNPPLLVGRVKGEKHRRVTSAIIRAEGRTVYTLSGSVYLLGRIDRKYRRWLRDQGIAYDPKVPIRNVV